MKLSDFNPTQNTSSLIAGEAIAAKDLVETWASDGKAYKVSISNYSAVGNVDYGTAQTSTATGRIAAQTSVVASDTQAYSRQAVVTDSNGSVFTLTDAGASVGLRLSKYAPSGDLLGTVAIATATQRLNHHILLLSNGNIACVTAVSTDLEYAVYDANLTVVKSLTTGPGITSHYFAACSLSAGGFAILYQMSGGTPLLSNIVTYDNTGTAVLSATNVWVRTGTTGTQYHRMLQLSNGNLAVAVSSANTAASIGLFSAVINTSGGIVRAFTSMDVTGSMGWYPELAVMTGFFAVSMATASNQIAYVYNNAGTLQGSNFTAATTAGNLILKTKMISDGTAFWLIWHRSSDTACCVTKLPTSGTGYLTNVVTTTTTQYNFFLDAFYENGVICAVSMANTGNTAPTMWLISTVTGFLRNTAPTTFGVVPGTTNGKHPRVIAGGDSSFIALYEYATTAGTHLCIGKYAKTAVIGVAQSSAAAAAAVRMFSQAGAYEINAVLGTSVAFDHSTTATVGNKGTILPRSVTLKGIGA